MKGVFNNLSIEPYNLIPNTSDTFSLLLKLGKPDSIGLTDGKVAK